jgi:DNA invertase Pin-like site-specific DNA recombinase
MEDIKKAFGYLRVSTVGQVDGDGFPRQRAAITKWAAANGIKIVRWFEEKGVSGTLLERPALSAMMVALMSNGVRMVIVEKLDRLARDQMVQETIIQTLLKQGFELVSAASGEENLCGNDPGRKLMRGIMGLISEYDKTMIVLKLKAARGRQRLETGRCEGRKPFGTRDGEPEIIARVKSMHAAGSNYEAIARQLNADGVPTRKLLGSWYPSGVRNIVRANT